MYSAQNFKNYPDGCEDYSRFADSLKTSSCCPSIPQEILNETLFPRCDYKLDKRGRSVCDKAECIATELHIMDMSTGYLDFDHSVGLLVNIFEESTGYVRI